VFPATLTKEKSPTDKKTSEINQETRYMVVSRVKFTRSARRVASVWTRIDWTRATHSAWTVESL